MASAPGRRSPNRARVADAVPVALVLAVLVPLVILDVDIPFYGAVAIILAGAGIIYAVERSEDPARAERRWGRPSVWGGAVVVMLGIAALAVVLLLG